MKTGRSFDELRDEVKRQTETKRDFIASSPTLNLDASGQLMQVGELGDFGLTKHAPPPNRAEVEYPGQVLRSDGRNLPRLVSRERQPLAKYVNRQKNGSDA